MNRIASLQTVLKKRRFSMAIFTTSEVLTNSVVYYLAGVSVGTGVLVVLPKSKPILYVSPLEHVRSTNVIIRSLDALDRDISRLRAKKIAIDERTMRVSTVSYLRRYVRGSFVDISKEIAFICRAKTTTEITSTRRAVRITEAIIASALKKWKSFRTEQDVAQYLKIETLQHNCELAFPPIVASGKNAAIPHHEPTATKLQKGFCIIDFGVKYNGFCADLTRTIFIGSPSRADRALYTSIIERKKRIEALLVPGTTVKQLWDAYHTGIPLMIHALGHGVGRDVHEAPLLGKGKESLEAGDILAVEPAMYKKGKYGIRIEDNYVIATRKPVVLSRHPTSIMCV